MAKEPYPNGIDCVWLASDKVGHVGVFVTAGMGPIPADALSPEVIPLIDIEERVFELPIVGGAKIQVVVPRPDDFIGLAERGFFVYDWTDIYMPIKNQTHEYKSVAIPTRPLLISELPFGLQKYIDNFRFTEIDFSDQRALDVANIPSILWTHVQK